MAEVLKEVGGCDVTASDLIDRSYGKVQSFFDVTEKYDNIVTNPPFSLAEDFFLHAYSIARNKVCLLLRTAFIESIGRHERIFTKNPPSRMWVFPERLSMYPEGYEVKGGGTTSYSWFVWDKNTSNASTEVHWFPVGYKKRYKNMALR